MAQPQIGTLLVLGADGDLTRRLLLAGLATLLAGDRAPDPPPFLLGAGLGDIATTDWRRRVRESFASVGVRGGGAAAVARRSRYVAGDVTDRTTLEQLLARCEGTPAIYFALPPAVTATVCRALTGLALPTGTTLVMEKPFGTDRESAGALNRLVRSLVPEEQVFRVDHFLGRSDVLNILGVRFANRLLEPVWNSLHVSSVAITYDEDLALEGRAGYYDHAGALVDMVQSHLLQVMAVLMMEPVATLDERSFRDAKAALLRATHLAGPPVSSSRRSRYTAGSIGTRTVPAYAREPGVVPSRRTETLAELTVEVRNARWAGVPVTLRSGKALARPRKEAVITLKPVSHLPTGLGGHETDDTLTIGFRPPRLAIGLDVSGPGDPLGLDPARVATDLASGDLTAYGEVLAGVLDGDPMLSVRGDVAEECWRIVQPVLEAWQADEVPLGTYPAGSGVDHGRRAGPTPTVRSTARRAETMGGTMSGEENIEMAKAAYAAFAAGDLEGASAALDDQIEWIVAGNSTISGTYSGKEEVIGFWMRLAEQGFTTRPQHFLADDERVVVLTSVTAGGETSDQADVLTLRDGKVVKFQAAGDTAMQERVWGSK